MSIEVWCRKEKWSSVSDKWEIKKFNSLREAMNFAEEYQFAMFQVNGYIAYTKNGGWVYEPSKENESVTPKLMTKAEVENLSDILKLNDSPK